MQEIQVSIVVPCYMQAHYLNESLQSVLDQTYDYWECIVVNDGSEDDTSTIAKLWVAKDNRFKYLYKDNGGLSSARNAGIAIAKGKFILPLDADDVLHPDYLKKLLPIIMADTSIAIVSCYTQFFTETILHKVGQLSPKGKDYKALLYVNQLVATSLYLKEDWVRIGGYDETMKKGFEDWEFWLRLTKNGERFHIYPEFLFYYRKADTSMLVDTITHYSDDVKQYIMNKHSELYIDDFENCVEVFTYHLKVSKAKAKQMEQSFEWKLGKILLKPLRVIQKLIQS